MDIGISIVVTFLLVLVNGYFSMSEMALVNAKHVLLQKDADEGRQEAPSRALSRWPADSGQFLATIQVAITLVGFFASAVAATNLSDPLAQPGCPDSGVRLALRSSRPAWHPCSSRSSCRT